MRKLDKLNMTFLIVIELSGFSSYIVQEESKVYLPKQHQELMSSKVQLEDQIPSEYTDEEQQEPEQEKERCYGTSIYIHL